MLPRPSRAGSAETKLYVTNVSTLATLADLRQLFRVVGEVVAVEFAAERGQGARATSAYVTMATLDGAEAAVRRLHGRLFHDRSVMVALAPQSESAGGRAAVAPPSKVGVSVQQQYRERHAMVYELDCSGLRLSLRFFFPNEGASDQRVEARAIQGADFVAEATAGTRGLALQAVADAWKHPSDSGSSPEVDWEGVGVALKTVRAV